MSRLHEQLHAFAAHLRDPETCPPPPGIEDRRLAVYRDLFFNSLRGLLETNFPVLHRTLGTQRWQGLVREFQARHRSQMPLFTGIGQEFVTFLQQRTGTTGAPWLAELAHYEWIELALQLSDAPVPPHDPLGDLLRGIPRVSPHAWPLAYRFPVHRIGPDWQPDAAGETPTLLLALRGPEGRVVFSELSPLAYRLIEQLDQDTGADGHTVLVRLADEAVAQDPDAFIARFIARGAALMQRMRAEGVLIGTAA